MLKPLENNDLKNLAIYAIKEDTFLKEYNIEISEYEALFRLAAGDARKLYNTLELVVAAESASLKGSGKNITLTDEKINAHVQRNITLYDKGGEQHYDIISAFIKSIRGSDPNAAVYWLARMVEGGEDVKFISRRLLILAAEDIGLANPNALLMAQSCFNAVSVIGWPESRIILSQLAIYLATSQKSNSAYQAINNAMAEVRESGDSPVPLHLRNAPTSFMKDLNYGADYKYAHSYSGNFVKENYMPDNLKGKIFYNPGANQRENEFRERLSRLWNEFYNYDNTE